MGYVMTKIEKLLLEIVDLKRNLHNATALQDWKKGEEFCARLIVKEKEFYEARRLRAED